MKEFEIKNESGRSMIEMLGVLAIIGVLSVGGIAGYSKAMMKYRINKTIEQITLIAGNVRTFFAPQRNYIGFDNQEHKQIIKKARLVPDEMWNDEIIYNIFGGAVTFDWQNRADNTLDAEDNKAFSMEFSDIPEEACIDIVTHDWNYANAAAIYISGGLSGTLKTPISVDKAVKYCSNNNTTTSITLYFDIQIGSVAWPESVFDN